MFWLSLEKTEANSNNNLMMRRAGSSRPNRGPKLKYVPEELVPLYLGCSVCGKQLTSIWLDCINIFSTIFHHWHFKFCWISHCVLCDNCRVGGAWANSFLNLKIKRHLSGILIITTLNSFGNILQLSDFTLLLFFWTPPGSFCQEPPASFTIQLWTFWKQTILLCGK